MENVKYYVSDSDFVFIQKSDGIYHFNPDGSVGNKSRYLEPDGMEWHEISREDAIELAKLEERIYG